MPRTGTVYNAPVSSWNPAASQTVMSSADWNALLADISTALSNSLIASQIQSGSLTYAGTLSGGPVTYTASLSPALTAYASGMLVVAKIGVTSGAAPTLNINSLGAKKIYALDAVGTSQIGAFDLIANSTVVLTYDAVLDSGAGGWILLTPIADEVLISSVTASGTTLDITLPAVFTGFRLIGSTLVSNAGPIQIGMRISTNNGSSYDAGVADYSRTFSFQAAALNAGANGGDQILLTDSGVVSAPHNLTAWITPGDGAYGLRIWGTACGTVAGPTFYSGHFSGARNAVGRATNIRILVANAFVGGLFRLYGSR